MKVGDTLYTSWISQDDLGSVPDIHKQVNRSVDKALANGMTAKITVTLEANEEEEMCG